MSAPLVALSDVGVRYDDVEALTSVDLTVLPAELLVVLGPSGSGKTTLLHAIAGFVPLATGQIDIGGIRVADPHASVPPEKRDLGVVFQHHALWPHLTASETVAFPLRQRRPAVGIEREVAGLLDRLGLGHLADRRPDQLSGGEQQRVSLARALARHPQVFLFDEPTAHLDGPLRSDLLEEIDRQRRREQAAGIYATHDAAEALSIADRILILRHGRVVQVGSPVDVYAQPVDRWAAALTGPASVLDASLIPGLPGEGRLRLDGGERDIEWSGTPDGAVLIRPEWAALGGPFAGVVEHVSYRGARTEYRLHTGAGSLIIAEDGAPRLSIGDETAWDVRRAHLLSPH